VGESTKFTLTRLLMSTGPGGPQDFRNFVPERFKLPWVNAMDLQSPIVEERKARWPGVHPFDHAGRERGDDAVVGDSSPIRSSPVSPTLTPFRCRRV
jgi:hypothetical protein